MNENTHPAVHALMALGVLEYRARLLQYASTKHEFTAQMVMDEIGGSRSALQAHLLSLVDARIFVRHPRTQGHGRGMIYWWSLDARRATEILGLISTDLGLEPQDEQSGL